MKLQPRIAHLFTQLISVRANIADLFSHFYSVE